MAKAVQLHDVPRCKQGLPEYPKFVIRTETVQYGRCRTWKALWDCHCGTRFEAMVSNVVRRHTRSCGCEQHLGMSRPTHGHFIGDKPSPTYKSWQAMIARCTNPKHPHYKHYGGRGIKICEAWLKSFPAFLADVGERPDGLTLDRKDNEGNYEPGNCRWATVLEQNRNRRPPRKRAKT